MSPTLSERIVASSIGARSTFSCPVSANAGVPAAASTIGIAAWAGSRNCHARIVPVCGSSTTPRRRKAQQS
jgi:hypothetical protein